MISNTLLEKLTQQVSVIADTIQSYGSPSNEAQTESLIIDPLLTALGYHVTDIVKRGYSTVTNTFPDYTILPSKPHQWILEAKKFGHKLQPHDELQATTYGYHAGTTWAVLTNGKTWYIYNVFYPKPSPEKRVLQIDDLFSSDAAIRMLACLAQQSMLDDELTHAWNQKRVADFVQRELATKNSPTRAFLRTQIQQSLNLGVEDALIGDVIGSLGKEIVTGSPVMPSKVRKRSAPISDPPVPANNVLTPSDISSTSLDTKYTFEQIAENPGIGMSRKPENLYFQDGTCIKIKTWANAAMEIILKLGSEKSLPSLPFSGGRKGKNYFLNATATHLNGKPMLSYREVQVGDTRIFVDTNRSVWDISKCIAAFLQAIGVSPDAVKVSIQP